MCGQAIMLRHVHGSWSQSQSTVPRKDEDIYQGDGVGGVLEKRAYREPNCRAPSLVSDRDGNIAQRRGDKLCRMEPPIVLDPFLLHQAPIPPEWFPLVIKMEEVFAADAA